MLDTWIFTRSGAGRFAFLPQCEWQQLTEQECCSARDSSEILDALLLVRGERFIEVQFWQRRSPSSAMRRLHTRKIGADSRLELHVLLSECFDQAALPAAMESSLGDYVRELLDVSSTASPLRCVA